ncbi:rRNA methyltransferase 3A, mitochondrial [Aplochiton taeniatus]
MAAYLRGMTCLLSFGRNEVLKREIEYIVDPRRYVRGLRRTPVKVLFPGGDTDIIHKVPKNQTGRHDNKKRSLEKKLKEPNANVSLEAERETHEKSLFSNHTNSSGNATPTWEKTKDLIGGLSFERAYPGDKRLARVVSVARSRTFREHQGKILLEGRRLICDALKAGANPQMVFFSTVERLRELPLDKLKRATLVKVKFDDIKIWSDLVAPQGVIAIFSRPDPTRLQFPQDQSGQSVPLSLICDNVRDPGNLGTILRCAAAAGCQEILLTKGCVDAWEPKVLRAAMGAHFHIPIFPSLDWDDIQKQLPKPVTVHIADNCSSSVRGAAMDTELKMPNKTTKAGDYGWVRNGPNHKHISYEDYDSDSDVEDSGFVPCKVDTKLYHESWAQKSTAIVIGGETHGLSLEAFQLAEKTAGQRLFIPVVPGVDSLNSAMAASILLFEGRRQLLNIMETSEKRAKSKLKLQSS